MKPPPPMPHEPELVTPSTSEVATAASTALPPCLRTPSPAWAARSPSAAIISWRASTAADGTGRAIIMASRTAKENARINAPAPNASPSRGIVGYGPALCLRALVMEHSGSRLIERGNKSSRIAGSTDTFEMSLYLKVLHSITYVKTNQCINPWHLEPVTTRENTLRADKSLLSV